MTYSLQRLLVILGLVMVPFYEIIFRLFPYSRVMAPDTRVPKELVAMAIVLAVGLLAIYGGTLKSFKNKWLIFIPLYILFSFFMAPQVDLVINGVSSGDFWFWKPFAQAICFMLFIVAIASMEEEGPIVVNAGDRMIFIDTGFKTIINAMVICGVVMAGYVLLQKFGFDQFWVIKTEKQMPDINGVMEPLLAGNLGNSTVVAGFIAMLVPLAFYLRRYIFVAIMVLAVLLTKSDMAILALAATGAITFLNHNRSLMIPAVFSGIIIVSIFLAMFIKNDAFHQKVVDRFSGRAALWGQMCADIRDGAIEKIPQDYSLTGVGFGRFGYIFPDRHNSMFRQAHNDPFEFIYNCGFIGGFLLIAGIISFLLSICSNLNPLSFAVLLSFVVFLILSLGSFPFQLATHQYYAAVLFGMLNNKLITR